MPRAVKLSDNLIEQARVSAKVMHRSTAGQIEYWSSIGKIAEENPDLSFDLIHDILISLEEVQLGHTEPYRFGCR